MIISHSLSSILIFLLLHFVPLKKILLLLLRRLSQTPSDLKQYKIQLAEAQRRDHRLLGTQLDLFSLQEEAGGGLVFWHPRGSTVRAIIEDYWKKAHTLNGYDLVYTPHVANVKLWKTSGHFDFYKDGMFSQMKVDEDEYQIRPMNCPFHCLMFKNTPRSYRDLPIRWAELGTVYRYERSGALHGLMRVRGFTQDDAHIFCRPDQLRDEIGAVLNLAEGILRRFGFEDFDVMLSTRPKKSVGSDEIWKQATDALEDSLKEKGWKYAVAEGDGSFYGPKIDIQIRDAIGRTWQCSTIQCDFNLPERFDMEYTSSTGTKERPIMVHRAIFGSVERFFGVLLENCAGEFPLWLAPAQVKLLPVTSQAFEYCQELKEKLTRAGIRVDVDRGSERLAKQVRNAELEKVPLLAIVGKKEVDNGELTVRSKKLGDLGVFKTDDFIGLLKHCIANAVEFSGDGGVGSKSSGEVKTK